MYSGYKTLSDIYTENIFTHSITFIFLFSMVSSVIFNCDVVQLIFFGLIMV